MCVYAELRPAGFKRDDHFRPVDVLEAELVLFHHPFFCFSAFDASLFAGLDHEMAFFHGAQHAFGFGALHRHHRHFPSQVFQILTMQLEGLVQTWRTHVKREVLDFAVQRRFDVTAQPHAKLDGRVFVVVHQHADVAAVGHGHVNQKAWGSLEVFLGEGADVFGSNQGVVCLTDDRTFRGQKRGLLAPPCVVRLSFHRKSRQFLPSVLPSLHVLCASNDC